jgi:endonuclease G, mitochondrial
MWRKMSECKLPSPSGRGRGWGRKFAEGAKKNATNTETIKMKYDPFYLSKEVALPKLTAAQLRDTIKDVNGNILVEHLHYSVAMCKSRRLAWYTVARLDAALKQKVGRSELRSSFRVEDQLEKKQVIHKDWYRASNELLDQGHLTPADAMEWGEDHEAAQTNANDTFYFTNAAPQHKELNRNEWRMLEKFIGEEALKTSHTRLLVLTGNILAPDDPEYLPEVEPDFKMRVPIRFWKVIYYMNRKEKLCRIGFVMGQQELMEESGLVAVSRDEKIHRDLDDAFSELGKNKTFQVSVKQIEKWTKHKFARATEVHPETEMTPLQLADLDLDVSKKTTEEGNPDGLIVGNQILRGLKF